MRLQKHTKLDHPKYRQITKAPAREQKDPKKPLIIAGITIVAIAALSVLILFTQQFVGKAIDIGLLGAGEGSLTEASQLYFPGESGSLELWVHLGSEQSVIGTIELEFDEKFVPPSFQSPASIQLNPLLNATIIDKSISGNIIDLSFVVLPQPDFAGDVNDLKLTGKFKLADVQFALKDDFVVQPDELFLEADISVNVLELLDSDSEDITKTVEGTTIMVTRECSVHPECELRHAQFPLCDVPRCVECLQNADCLGATSQCNSGVCVEPVEESASSAEGTDDSAAGDSAAGDSEEDPDAGDTGSTVLDVEIQPTLVDEKTGKDFATTITTPTSFTEQVILYTVLRDESGKILAFQSEVLPGLEDSAAYKSTVNYPFPNAVKTKTVIIYDKLPDEGTLVLAVLESEYP